MVYGLLRRFTPRNDSIHKLVIARVAYNSWQSRYGNHHTQPKLVIAKAITPTSSLRRPKACGNLGMRHNYSFMEFFFFSVFVLTFCGLWIASSFHSSQ